MHHAKPSKTIPVVAGGLFLGVLSGIPVINFINCACCALVIGGGILSSYLYMKDYPPEQPRVQYGDGALLGLLAGLLGAVVSTIIAIPFQLLVGGASNAGMLEALRSQPDIPAEIIDMIEPFFQGGINMLAILFGLLVGSVLYSIFGMLGGVIGVALFGPKGGNAPQAAPAPYAPAPPTRPIQPPPPAPRPPAAGVENDHNQGGPGEQ